MIKVLEIQAFFRSFASSSAFSFNFWAATCRYLIKWLLVKIRVFKLITLVPDWLGWGEERRGGGQVVMPSISENTCCERVSIMSSK